MNEQLLKTSEGRWQIFIVDLNFFDAISRMQKKKKNKNKKKKKKRKALHGNIIKVNVSLHLWSTRHEYIMHAI